MAYKPKIYMPGDAVSVEDLNRVENGIASLDSMIQTKSTQSQTSSQSLLTQKLRLDGSSTMQNTLITSNGNISMYGNTGISGVYADGNSINFSAPNGSIYLGDRPIATYKDYAPMSCMASVERYNSTNSGWVQLNTFSNTGSSTDRYALGSDKRSISCTKRTLSLIIVSVTVECTVDNGGASLSIFASGWHGPIQLYCDPIGAGKVAYLTAADIAFVSSEYPAEFLISGSGYVTVNVTIMSIPE